MGELGAGRRPRPRPEPIGEGEESVWDYPRPPRLEPTDRIVRVELDGVTVAECRRALRVLETSHPPTYYVHPYDVDLDLVEPAGGRSGCEWKGEASYWNVVVGERRVIRGAWYYPLPLTPYEQIADHVAFYPSMFECYVDGERVRPQPGDFYGGWVTHDVKGPFKGIPGSSGW